MQIPDLVAVAGVLALILLLLATLAEQRAGGAARSVSPARLEQPPAPHKERRRHMNLGGGL